MKFSLFAFALFSTTVFAIGTNELTGSFDITEKNIPALVSDASFMNGATSSVLVDKSRMPASEQDEIKSPSHVTELTGTFE